MLPPRLAPIQIVIIPIGRDEGGEAAAPRPRSWPPSCGPAECGCTSTTVTPRPDSSSTIGSSRECRYGPSSARGISKPATCWWLTGLASTTRRAGPSKRQIPFDDFVARVPSMLDEYHGYLLARADAFREENTSTVRRLGRVRRPGWRPALPSRSIAVVPSARTTSSRRPRPPPGVSPPTVIPPKVSAFVATTPPTYGKRVVFAGRTSEPGPAQSSLVRFKGRSRRSWVFLVTPGLIRWSTVKGGRRCSSIVTNA